MYISACGLICDNCQFFNKECAGCMQTQGKPFWTAFEGNVSVCPLFDCSVNKNNFKNCGDCVDLPCKMFTDLKDPNISEEEHIKSISARVKVLNS